MGFVGNVVDTITGKNAAKDAAENQQKATDASIEFQREALDSSRADLQPFRQAGVNAIDDLNSQIANMQTSSGLDTSDISDFVSQGGNLGADLQAFMSPDAQADYLQNDPLYAAIADDTNRRLNAQAAAAGKLHSGGTAKALQDNMMLLGRERINDRINQLTTGFNVGSTDRSNRLNELTTKFNLDFNKTNLDSNLQNQKTNSLFNLVTQGQNAAAQQATATQNTGNALSNLTVAQGNANAASEVAAHNNLISLVNGGMQAGAAYMGAQQENNMVQGVDYRVPMSARGLDVTGAVNGYMAGQQNKRQNALLDLTTQEKEQRMQHLDDESRMKSIAGFAVKIKPFLDAGDSAGAQRVFNQRISEIKSRGGNPEDSLELAPFLMSGDLESAKGMVDSAIGAAQQTGYLKAPEGISAADSKAQFGGQEIVKDSVGNLFFATSVRNPLTKEVEPSLVPVSGGNIKPEGALSMVNGAGLTALENVNQKRDESAASAEGKLTTEIELGGEAAEIKEFGKLRGASRAAAIDSGVDRVNKIDTNLANLDRAIDAIDRGANTGAIESRFFPSVKAATVELDQIQRELGLDVLNAATFGALSKSEMDMALETALPTGLNPPELRQWLIKKKTSQEKLKNYLYEQIDFLDQGGTVASFIRMKRRAVDQNEVTNNAPQEDVGGFDDSLLEFMEPEERALFQ